MHPRDIGNWLKDRLRSKYFLPILFFILFSTIVLFPLVHYHYIYSSTGDDTAMHLQVMDKVVAHDSIPMVEGWPKVSYYGPILLGIICRLTGAGTDTLFLIFNYLVLILAATSIYFLLAKLVNKWAGLVSIPIVFFCTPNILTLFYCGTIFNVLGMYVILPLAILFLVFWIKENKDYQLVLSLIFFLLCGVLHSLTALYVFNAIALFLVGALIYYIAKRNKEELKRIGLFSGAFLVTNLLIPCLVLPDFLNLELLAAAAPFNSILTSIPRVSPFQFFTIYLPLCTSAILFSGLALIVILRIKHRLVLDKGTILLGLILLVFIVAFIPEIILASDSIRVALDLSTFLAILAAIFVGILVKNRKIKRMILPTFISLAILGSILPLVTWFGYNSAIRPVDKEAIAYLNSQSNVTYTTSTQIAPWIYSRFTKGKYMEDGGEYIVYRTKPMTCKTSPECYWYQYGKPSEKSDYANMKLLAVFEDDKVEVYVYKR